MRLRSRTRRVVAAVLALALIGASCGGDDEDDAEPAALDEDAPEPVADTSPTGVTAVDALLDPEDLPGWTVREDPVEYRGDEIRPLLLTPCGRPIVGAAASDGAASVSFETTETSTPFVLIHTVLAQPAEIGRTFIDEAIADAGDCTTTWTVGSGDDQLTYVPAERPSVSIRGTGTASFAAEWTGTDGVTSEVSIVQMRCDGLVSRLAIWHAVGSQDADVVLDELAGLAFAELKPPGAVVAPCLARLFQQIRPAPQFEWTDRPWQTIDLRDRPAWVTALSATRTTRRLPAPTEVEDDFWDADRDGGVDVADITVLLAMWVLQPDTLAARAPNDEIRAVILAGRALLDATPVGACLTASVHVFQVLNGEESLELAELAGCGAAVVSRIGGSGVRQLSTLGGSRWRQAVETTARSIDNGDLDTAAEIFERVSRFGSSEQRSLYYAQCGAGAATLLGVEARTYCLALPALDGE